MTAQGERMVPILQLLVIFLLGAVQAFASDALSVDIPALREAFLKEHRVLEKVLEGKSQWAGTFCEGNYHYRILLKTTVDDLSI